MGMLCQAGDTRCKQPCSWAASALSAAVSCLNYLPIAIAFCGNGTTSWEKQQADQVRTISRRLIGLKGVRTGP